MAFGSIRAVVPGLGSARGPGYRSYGLGLVVPETSGNVFDSLVQLEYESGIPRNPFINAGAIVVTDELLDLYDDHRQFPLDGVNGRAWRSY